MINFNDAKEVASAIQYTNVNPNLTRDQVLAHLKTCVDYGFNAAMIGPCWVPLAKSVLAGTEVRVASTLNFPMANDTLEMKLAALKELAKAGADEFDFPPNPGYLLGGDVELYREELNLIVKAAHDEGMVIKAMLEFGFITDNKLKAISAQIAYESGIDWVKQSSGWGVGGCVATEEDVRILAENIQAPCRVKVSGKVNTREKMEALFKAGAELVGTSSGPAIVDGLVGDIEGY
ncbi:deoxyribose-phosphate aldolase [Schaalia sp. ZJ405]|uniref:deoxyribose-phosphate aldolase n=1 Tax=Schaalia sp. ZJ405 TaxID=2709403 RepID=UPI0013EE28C5|nr:deoxyribose-phosphate aldolase [Schaalia sp. ZJ405]QPK81275.1 deoxyribose-phosphate aldolase [Schaalia sp. ZJ405]